MMMDNNCLDRGGLMHRSSTRWTGESGGGEWKRRSDL